MLRRRRVLWAVAGAVVAIAVTAGSVEFVRGSAPEAQRVTGSAARVLVISLPYVSWADLQAVRTPNLERLFAESAVGNLTTRTVGASDLASGYASVGAGNRAAGSGTPADGDALEVGEAFGTSTAGAVYEQRTTRHVASGIVHLGLAPLVRANRTSPVHARVGLLGDALEAAGYTRAVFGNADGSAPGDRLGQYRRFVASALMGSDGAVPAGAVGPELLRRDPGAPFGTRLDVDALMEAFRATWGRRTVAVVEASDLARAAALGPFSTDEQRVRVLRDALGAADALVGRLLTEIDPQRDAVIVMSPTPSASTSSLTFVSVRAPGVEPGLLRTASTRRVGYTLLADVGPTILDALGLPRAKRMSGRPMVVTATDGDAASRIRFLVDSGAAALFRDRVRTSVIVAFITLVGLLGVVAITVFTAGGRRARVFVRFAAHALLGFIPAVYFARFVAFSELGFAPYAAFLAAVAIALGALYVAAGHRNELDSTIVALGTLAAVLAVDVLTGAHLQLSTAFGYSPIVGVRFSGVGNVSYALLGAAAILLAGLLAHRVGGRRGAWVGVAVLVIAFVADAAPMWGADVGGVLSLIPAFGVTGALVLGKRLRMRVRTALAWVGAVVVGIAAVTAVDLARPASDQTHLGRLVQRIEDDGLSVFTDTISRKLDQNLTSLTHSDWRALVPLALVILAYLAWCPPRRIRSLLAGVPELRASFVGFTIAAVAGYALNDSGIAIPAVMLGVLTPALLGLLTAPSLFQVSPLPGLPRVRRPIPVVEVA